MVPDAIDRRDFLKQASATIAVGAVVPVTDAPAPFPAPASFTAQASPAMEIATIATSPAAWPGTPTGGRSARSTAWCSPGCSRTSAVPPSACVSLETHLSRGAGRPCHRQPFHPRRMPALHSRIPAQVGHVDPARNAHG